MWLQASAGVALYTFAIQLMHVAFFWVLFVPASSANSMDNGRAAIGDSLGILSAPSYDHSTGQASIGGVTLGRSELFGMDVDRAITENHFEADGSYQDEQRLQQNAQTLSNRIDSNTRGQESDFDVAAYNTLQGSIGQRTTLGHDDSIMTDSSDYLNKAAQDVGDPNSDLFSACTTETNQVTVGREYVGRQQYSCIEPDRSNLQLCELDRHLLQPIKKTGGSGEVKVIDSRTFDLAIGKVGNNYYGDGGQLCKIYPSFVEFELRNDLEIESATLSQALFDDSIQIKLNDEIIYQHAGGGVVDSDGFPTEEGNCERKTSWNIHPNKNVTSSFNQARAMGYGRIKFHIKVAVKGGGEGYVWLRVKTKNNVRTREVIRQNPPGCAAQIGYSQPSNTCESTILPGTNSLFDPQCDHPNNRNPGNGQICSFTGWECVEEDPYYDPVNDPLVSDLPITIYNGGNYYGGENVENRCTKANAVNYRCEPTGNVQVCGVPGWPDDLTEVCGSFSEINSRIPDRCEPYRDNPDCSLIQSNPQFVDPVTGRAFASESVYECNVYQNNDYTYTTEENICTGEMVCVGGDCNFSNPETNEDFAEAMAVFSMLEDIKGNNSCENPDDISTCQIFRGSPDYCGVEKTGLGFNCCEITAGKTNVFEYIKGMYSVYQLDQIMMGIDSGNMVVGAWKGMSQPVHDSVAYVSDAFSSGWDHVVRNVTGEVATESGSTTMPSIADAVSEAIFDKTIDELKQQIMQKVYEMLPESIGNALFTTGGSAAGSGGSAAGAQTVTGLNPAISGAFTAIMAAYAAYQLVKLGLQMVSQCEDKEMEMGMKLDQKQCIYTSTKCIKKSPFGCLVDRRYYCCYPSPLGRIIMEQAAPVLGITIDSQSGQCEGMTFDQAANFDWSTLDLSEWESYLMASGVVVDHNDLDIETLSDNPLLPNNEFALDPVELNQTRFEENNISDTNNANVENASPENLDCSIWPRPPVCGSPLSPLD
ncbi:conjugal transfer protein TraN [uncultured Photobacterium sp.]|uniref:conjugal transfer protein TraN n=1 Tax=uncultured Photobacterium sp. TaxID=173973 RepID=UPI00261D686E|nr:conjugal transfer protein TraN [uncultured Photobacterium sp.]